MGCSSLYAQPIIPQNTTDKKTSLDTLLAQRDVVTTDTISIEYSRDSIADPIEYAAKDSMIYDIPNQKIYLYGDASVKQKTLLVTAAFILIDSKTNLLAAEVAKDGKTGKVHFKDAEQDVVADRIKYNFKTKKGKVYNTRTKQGEKDYVQSEEGKIIGKDEKVGRLDDAIYGKNALITTCNLDEPHFGILSTKQKVIPNKMVIVGPSTLVVAGVPTPLIVPFGFFPLTQGKRGGFLMPDNFETSLSLGIGIQNIGWYFPINQNMDLQVRGDIYTRGSWRTRTVLRYAERYKAQGTLNVTYSSLKTGDQRSLNDYNDRRDVGINWSHSQDRAANPNQTFSANVNIATGEALRNQRTDAASRTSANLSSNISYSRQLGSGYQLSSAFSHSQNIGDRSMVLSLPNLNFGTPTIFPFKRRNPIGAERWYEKINMSYNSNFTTRLATKDTTFFKGDIETMRNQVQSGITNSVPISASFSVLKYFTITPFFNYNENWHLTKTKKTLDEEVITKTRVTDAGIVTDTLQAGKVINTTSLGFARSNSFNSGIGIGTNLYGMVNFHTKNTGLRAVRHVVRPTVSFNYAPENLQSQYVDSTRFSLAWRNRNSYQKYNYFEQNPAPLLFNGKTSAIALGVNSTVEAKYAVRKDSVLTEKRVQVFNLNFNTNYNFAADSFRLAPLSMNANTTLFGIVNLTASTSFDAYAQSKSGRRLRTFAYYTDDKLAHFQSASIAASTFFDGAKLKQLLGEKPKTADNATNPQDKKTVEKDFITNGGLSYNLLFSGRKTKSGQDSVAVTTHDISFNVNLNLTNNWTFTVGRIGYDLVGKRLTYPDFQLYRDLHCWEMGMSWQPQIDTYTFFIRAKPGSLDFLKVPYNKNILDPNTQF